MALSWAPILDASYGDNHEGRVFSRFALQMRNLHEMGLVGSHFGTNWEPYGTTYAHHPPMATVVASIFSSLPGEAEWQIRLGPYLLGLIALPAAGWLLRSLGLRRVAALLTLGLLASSPLYWFYGRIVFDLGPIIVMAAVLARLRPEPHPSRRLVALACVVCALTTASGWLAIAFAAAFGIWLAAGPRRVDRVALAVGSSMAVGAIATLAFVITLTDPGELRSQTTERTGSGGRGLLDFLSIQWGWLTDLFPAWSLLLLPLGVLAALVRRETRLLTALASIVAVLWIVLLRDGATIHDFWIYSLLVPFVIGVGTLLDSLQDLITKRVASPGVRVGGTIFAGFGLVLAFALLITGGLAKEHITGPLAAGALVEGHQPPASQRTAWVVRTYTPRWVAFYWDLPVQAVHRRDVRTIPDTDLVLINRLRPPPTWLAASVTDRPVERRGPYLLVTGAALRHSLLPHHPNGARSRASALTACHPGNLCQP